MAEEVSRRRACYCTFLNRQKCLPAYLTNESTDNSAIKRPFKMIKLKKTVELFTSKPSKKPWYEFHNL